MIKKIIYFTDFNLTITSTKSLDRVLGYASRINNKRKYLFVSKILGKHIPVSPSKLIKVHKRLANLVNPIIANKNVLVIGLAETATGLGWGVFDQIKAVSKIYIHTSRVKLRHKLMFEFEESHSHAVEQYLYFPKHKQFKPEEIDQIIIVDDELTTGNTIQNLINQLHGVFNQSKISVLTLLNWMNYKKSFKISALNEGKFCVEEYVTNTLPPIFSSGNSKKYLSKRLANEYGRVGSFVFPEISKSVITKVRKFKNKKILLLGTGEFMHYPLVISKYFHKSNNLKIQSTTRSPVQIGGDIHSKLVFNDNYYPSVTNYLYNVIDKEYDVVFLFYEAKSNSDHLLISQLSEKFKKVIQIYL
jgi:uracil phosphoribosyltransferase